MPLRPRKRNGNKMVEKISLSKNRQGEHTLIGGHTHGKVYIGRLKFRDGSIHRVAIKIFIEQLGSREAKAYKQVIKDLIKAGVKLPKMGIIKMMTERAPKGEWVQVSQLFGGTQGGSKIVSKSLYTMGWELETEKTHEDAVDQLTRVANAGYWPSQDIIEPFKDQDKGVVPFDLDLCVKTRLQERVTPINMRAQKLVHAIGDLAPKGTDWYNHLAKIALRTAKPELKRQIERQLEIAAQERRD